MTTRFTRVHPQTPFGLYLTARQAELGVSTRKIAHTLGCHESTMNVIKTNQPFPAILWPADFYMLGELLKERPLVLEALYLQQKQYVEEIDWSDRRLVPLLQYEEDHDMLLLLSEQDRREVRDIIQMKFARLPHATKMAFRRREKKRHTHHPLLHTKSVSSQRHRIEQRDGEEERVEV